MRSTLVCALGALAVGCSATQSSSSGGSNAAPTADQQKAAANLAGLISDHWRKAGVTPAPPASDGEYLRRVSLDLIGRIPTLAETRAYLADANPDKRRQLIDRLLASPEFAEHWADVYSDLLWKVEGAKRMDRYDPRSFLVTAFNENWRYDRLVEAVLTASGDVRENGAVAFVAVRARGGGGPEAVAGAAARLFLGLNIQCAQCHDHPYDTRWKQQDFYGLVAYFARTKVKREKGAPDMDMAMDMDMAAGMPAGKMPVSFSVFDQRRGEARMRAPRSEQEVVVKPRFLGRETPFTPLPPGTVEDRPQRRFRFAAQFNDRNENRRLAFARAVVASDLFPKAMVARTWAQLLGADMADPWDDLGAENDPRHPVMLNRLAGDFRASGFDVKQLVRQLVLSPAYDRGAPVDSGAGAHAFAAARVRPLAPAQLFRTLITATGADDIVRHRQRRGQEQGPVEGKDRADRLMAQGLKEYRFTFEDDEMADADFDGSMPQALLLLNGELTNSGSRAVDGGVLGGILASTRSPAERLEQMFLAVYSRPPSPEEKDLFLPTLMTPQAARDRRAYEDLYFALITSTESVTNH
jgi:hypothetical protein